MSRKIRVAAYVRVSVQSEQMQHSLQAQAKYYERMISKNLAWEFVGIFKDFGISGTGTKKRVEFNRLMEECEAGKIDKIFVKSVSRFARNTLDLLKTIRHLKELGISVWFEEENIDSLTQEGELLLTLIASMAQAESESISESIKWAIRKGFENGIGNTKHRTFGYEWIENRLVVVPEEAKVVQQIYANFLKGYSHTRTAEELKREAITSVHGNFLSVSAISFILRNVTYTGNMLLQKTFTKDPISQRKLINTGQLPQYLVRDTHEAIIDMETFKKVQEIFIKNKEEKKFPYNRTGKIYPFTKKIICNSCGRHYTRQLWHNGRCPTWVCTGKKAQSRRCYSKNIPEKKLLEASKEVLKLEEFDEKIFDTQVESIVVQGENKLIFNMNTGIKIEKYWEHTARQEAWTTERKALHMARRNETPAKVRGSSYLTGKIRCEICGKNYNKLTKHLKEKGQIVFWKCRECSARSITQEHLNCIVAKALEVEKMTEEIFKEQIDHIGMGRPGNLTVYQKNGERICKRYRSLAIEKNKSHAILIKKDA